MIIFGTRGVTYNKTKGEFHCPRCGPGRFHHKRVRRFFTLYFIPVLPLDLLGEYVECQGCTGTFNPEVLEYDPDADKANFEAEFHRAIRRVMVVMMLADGVIDDDEVRVILEIYEKLAGVAMDEGDLQREVARAQSEGLDVAAALAPYRGTLNDAGKEMVLRAAFHVALADGDFADEERALIQRIAAALEVSPAHLSGVLQQLSG
jgi:tellurite resistance protein